jgi:hypothetical protein
MQENVMTNARAFLKRNKERVILYGVLVAFFIVVGSGYFLRGGRKQELEQTKEAIPKAVALQVRQGVEGSAQEQGATGSTPFFLEPSPDQLLQQLTSLENLNEGAVEGRYVGLRVLWPAYFFTLEEGQGSKRSLVLDVDEDGFGVILESEVDPAAYPQLTTLEVGKKLWIGGEIQAVDRAGTGTVFLKVENIIFDGDPTVSPQKMVK